MSAAVFVSETLRALSLGLGVPRGKTAPRRRLESACGQQNNAPSAIDDLSPAERIKVLADALIASLASPDEYLGRPADYENAIERAASGHAVTADSTRRLAGAVRAHRMICIVGEDMPGMTALAGSVCTNIYKFHPRLTTRRVAPC